MSMYPCPRLVSTCLAMTALPFLVAAQAPRPDAAAVPPQPLNLPAVSSRLDCAALAAADVSAAVGAKTVIQSVEVVNDGKNAAYCKLQAEVDGYARFELRLPVAVWTQRLLFGGGPGAQVAPGEVQLDQFATVSWQDLGRRGREDDFASNPAWRINGAYRGMHLQVLAAKALISMYYGQAPRFSYFNACSRPGHEGMMEIQRFPQDFDGVGAGCPPINFSVNQTLFQGWNVLTNTGADRKPILTADKLPLLHAAVLAQCDAADGVRDGILSDPFACHPNLAAVQCKPSQDPASCLTPEQVHVAEELYRGAHDAQGRKLAPTGVLPGSELAWTSTIVPGGGRPGEARDQTTTAIRSQFFWPALSSTWELGDLQFDRTTFEGVTRWHGLWDATHTDLSAFADAGHKLMLWQGLGDTNVLPAQAILYYTALQQRMGASRVEDFARLYVLPGVYHCGWGDGPVITGLLPSLMAWVERGVAPGALNGVHTPAAGPGAGPAAAAPVADLTRPIYPYPYTARYTGTGDIRAAANYVQGPARQAPAEWADWLGARFYQPRPIQWCTATATTLDCKDSR